MARIAGKRTISRKMKPAKQYYENGLGMDTPWLDNGRHSAVAAPGKMGKSIQPQNRSFSCRHTAFLKQGYSRESPRMPIEFLQPSVLHGAQCIWCKKLHPNIFTPIYPIHLRIQYAPAFYPGLILFGPHNRISFNIKSMQ